MSKENDKGMEFILSLMAKNMRENGIWTFKMDMAPSIS